MGEEVKHKFRIEVDQEGCVGGGQCVFAAPEVFTQRDEDGIVEVLVEHPSEDQIPNVEEAVEVCPAAVIKLVALDS